MRPAYHDRKSPSRTSNHLLLAPAGRLEAIVTGPPPRTHSALRTLCVDTGPDGDPNPEMVLADVVQPSSVQPSSDLSWEHAHVVDHRPPVYNPIDVEALKKT